ncbi:MAG TPA: FtsW/RodA/SpoVE family cell cycle protein [Candidatus Coprenecus pullistercoris]|nr:FtsW/RodA/SpoVE family cell cycle protein [Candidatus Coprenecus pullistercoris]
MSGTLEHRIKNLHGDKYIWLTFIVFAMISVLVVYSACSALALRSGTPALNFMIRQAGFYVLGFAIVLICYAVPLKIYRRGSFFIMGAAIILLMLTPFLDPEHKRNITLLGISIQPSEIAKIATVLYLAKTIETCSFKTFWEYALRILAPVGAVCVLCLIGSASAMLITGFISFIILVCSNKVPRKYLLWTIPVIIGALGIVVLAHAINPDLFERIDTVTERFTRHFSDEENMTAAELEEMKNKTFQMEQARDAIQLGGLSGLGPGNSFKRDVLPNAYDDYIFCIIVEEYGLIGGTIVILLYLFFFYRCMRIAASCKKDFALITVLGLSTLITLQAFLHIFVNTGIVPVTGQTLPMISRGGTSLVIMSSAFGIILAVNRTIEIKEMRLKAKKEAKS